MTFGGPLQCKLFSDSMIPLEDSSAVIQKESKTNLGLPPSVRKGIFSPKIIMMFHCHSENSDSLALTGHLARRHELFSYLPRSSKMTAERAFGRLKGSI